MRHGFWIRNGLQHSPGASVELAEAAEDGGWDGVFVSDAVMEHHDDPFVVLAAIAARTNRVALGTWVTPLVARDELAIARAAAGVDQLSDGRLLLGVGIGNDVEHRGLGVDRQGLGRRHEEALEVLDRLLRGDDVSSGTASRHLEGVSLITRPVQAPRPPILLAASWPNRAGVRRAARWDGLMPQWPGLAEGRDPSVPTGARISELEALLDCYRAAGGEGPVVVPRMERYGPDYDRRCEDLGVSWLLTCDSLDAAALRSGTPARAN